MLDLFDAFERPQDICATAVRPFRIASSFFAEVAYLSNRKPCESIAIPDSCSECVTRIHTSFDSTLLRMCRGIGPWLEHFKQFYNSDAFGFVVERCEYLVEILCDQTQICSRGADETEDQLGPSGSRNARRGG